MRILRQKPSRWIEIAYFIDNRRSYQAFFAFESRGEIDPLLSFDEFTVLFIARVGVDGPASTAEDIVVVGGGGVGVGGGGNEWLLVHSCLVWFDVGMEGVP